MEIFDGLPEDGAKPIKKICSPSIKLVRDSNGEFNEQQTFISKGNILSLVLRRSSNPTNPDDVDYVDGAYLFHDGKFFWFLRSNVSRKKIA